MTTDGIVTFTKKFEKMLHTLQVKQKFKSFFNALDVCAILPHETQ